MTAYVLKLYVTRQSPQSERAIANLRLLCENQLQGQYQLVIIDVLEFPRLAEAEKIIATPTLIKALPPPLKRLIGDLSDATEVLNGLEIDIPHPGPSPTGNLADRPRDDAPS
jgi:circadian clock protein KaiB